MSRPYTSIDGNPLESRHYDVAEITALIDLNAQYAIDAIRRAAIIHTTISITIATHEHHVASWAGSAAWLVSRTAWLESVRRRHLCKECGAEVVEGIERSMGVIP